MQRNAMLDLLDPEYFISIIVQRLNSKGCTSKIDPIDSFCGSQRGFLNITVRWNGRKSAKINTLHQEGVCGSKYTTYIMHAPDIIKDDNDGGFTSMLKFIDRLPV